MVIADIPFLDDAARAERLDVYLPDDARTSPWPAVLLIHGGGWRVGDKADARERNIGATLSAHGYAVFSVNYLLNTRDRIAWPQNFADCTAAMRFIQRESARFHLDPARIALMGSSAGGHLALLLAATGGADRLAHAGQHPDPDPTVRCVVNFYGPADIPASFHAEFAGGTAAETAANLRAAGATAWLTPRIAPILIAHGTADTIVPVETSRDLVRLLQARNLPHTYVEVSGAPHSFHLQPQEMDLRPVVLAFLDQHLRRPLTNP